jgi:two-component system response regulator RegA
MPGTTHTRTLLLIDADHPFLIRAERFFRDAGWAVNVERESGSPAPPHQLGAQPSHIVLDICPEGRPCFQLLAVLRRRFAQATILALTAYPALQIATSAVRFGADDCVAKPLDPAHLMRLLSEPPAATGRSTEAARLPLPSLARIEWEYIQRVLAYQGTNLSRAARVLGIQRSTLQRRLRKYPPLV